MYCHVYLYYRKCIRKCKCKRKTYPNRLPGLDAILPQLESTCVLCSQLLAPQDAAVARSGGKNQIQPMFTVPSPQMLFAVYSPARCPLPV